MLDPVLQRLHMAEHHRRRRTQPQPMRRVHHLQPIVAHGFERRDAPPHPVHQYFPAPAGDRSQSRPDEPRDDLLQRHSEDLPEMDEFARTEAVNVDRGELLFYMRQQILVPLQRELGMMAALHQDLRAAPREGFLNLPVHFLQRDDVGAGVALRAVKGAEFAIDIADVGVVDIAVHDVGDDPVAAAVVGRRAGQLAAAMGQHAQFLKRQPVKPPRPGLINSPAAPDFLQQIIRWLLVKHRTALHTAPAALPFQPRNFRACIENSSGVLAARRGGWRRCSSVEDPRGIFSLRRASPSTPPRRNPFPDQFSKRALIPGILRNRRPVWREPTTGVLCRQARRPDGEPGS